MSWFNDLFGASGVAQSAVKIAEDIGLLKDPALTEKYQEALLSYQTQLESKANELEAIAQKDRDSARQREIAVKDKTPAVLATVVVVGFFSILYLMIFTTVSEAAHDAVMLLLGTLSGALVSVFSYYFGSSSGSANKSALIEKVLNGNGKK